MLFGAIVRSPYAHARIKSIDKSKALAVPGVVAVLTADDLKPVKLHWMPTLGGDVQAVLADKKVCFQIQEVAMVLATDRYAAADGVDAVEVDYEELPAIVDPKQAMATDAPVIREDIADKDEVGHGQRTHPNHIFTWEAGDKAATDAAFANAAVTVREEILNPRVHPCPLETCGCVASFDKVTRPAHGVHHLAGAAPRAHRAGHALGHPREQDPHRSAATSAAASATRCRSIPATSSRSSPRSSPACRSSGSSRASTTSPPPASRATTTASASSPPTRTAASRRLRFTALADHGAFNSHVSATKLPAGLFSICTGSYDIPKAYCRVDAVYTNKAPGGVAYRCSLRVTEAVYLIERMIDVLAQKLGHRQGRDPPPQLRQGGAVPVHDGARLDARQRRLPPGAREGAEGGRLRGPAPRAGGRSADRRAS